MKPFILKLCAKHVKGFAVTRDDELAVRDMLYRLGRYSRLVDRLRGSAFFDKDRVLPIAIGRHSVLITALEDIRCDRRQGLR